jgi:hypothetical protein
MKEFDAEYRRVGFVGTNSARRARARIALALAVLALGAAGVAAAAMHSVKLGPLVCETTGGGRFVKIPGFPGEKIDRRLLADVDYLQERFKIFVTDGYSLDPVHSHNGEHPIGLALDIVPDFARGGSWRRITRLANWAEPKQDRPRAPFRWVGYNGDPGHGRGHHLHLSYLHSPTRYNDPARTMQSVKCPGAGGNDPKDGGGSASGSGGVGLSRHDLKRFERKHPETGGIGIHGRADTPGRVPPADPRSRLEGQYTELLRQPR